MEKIEERNKKIINKENKTMKTHIKIFDTTLRDGEQTPRVNLNAEEKLTIGKFGSGYN